MDREKQDLPKPGDLITEESPYVILHLQDSGEITGYTSHGRCPLPGEGRQCYLPLEKEMIREVEGKGYSVTGLLFKDGRIVIPMRRRVARVAYKVKRFTQWRRNLAEVTSLLLEFVKLIAANFLAVLSASLLGSYLVVLLYEHKLAELSSLADFTVLFIPLFSAAMVLVSLFITIAYGRRMARRERDQSVRPLLFLSFIKPIQSRQELEAEFGNLIVCGAGEGELYYARVSVENSGLGLAINISFIASHGGKFQRMGHNIKRLPVGEAAEIVLGVPLKWLEDGMQLYSRCTDVYGNKKVNFHMLLGNQRQGIMPVADIYVDEDSKLFRKFKKEDEKMLLSDTRFRS